MLILVINFIASVVAGSIGKDFWVACRVRVLNYKPKKKTKPKTPKRLRVSMSSFHNANRMFLRANPTRPFTNDLENCTWTEQVTNCPWGFIASDPVTDWGRLNPQCNNNTVVWIWKGRACLPGSTTSSLLGVNSLHFRREKCLWPLLEGV